jgi:hypothetical protein
MSGNVTMNLHCFYLIGILFLTISASNQCGQPFSKLANTLFSKSSDQEVQSQLIASQVSAGDEQGGQEHMLVGLDPVLPVATINHESPANPETSFFKLKKLIIDQYPASYISAVMGYYYQKSYKKMLDDVTPEGQNLLTVAVIAGAGDLVDIIVEKEPSSFVQLDQAGNTLLHHAAQHSRHGIVDLLLQKIQREVASSQDRKLVSYFVNCQNNEGDTALHYALEADSLAAVRSLLRVQAAMDIKNKKGKTVVERAYEIENGEKLDELD